MRAFTAGRVRVWVWACAAISVSLLMASVAAASKPPKCLVVGAGGSHRTLQAAVDAASPGDKLKVKGTCYGDTTIGKNLTIVGHSNPAFGPATLNGGGKAQTQSVIVNLGATVAIIGLTITGGHNTEIGPGHEATEEKGGGIYNERGSLTLTNSVVRGNIAVPSGRPNPPQYPFGGGGIYNGGGSLTLNHSTVSDNEGLGKGGGIDNEEGSLTLNHSTVSGNRTTGSNRGAGAGFSHRGGGIYNAGGPVTLTNSTVTGNEGGARGGGIENNEGSFTLEKSTVAGNTARGSGGGIGNLGSLTLDDSDVTGNTAEGSGGFVPAFGGGIVNNASLALNGSSSVTDNTAAEQGGGIYNYQSSGATITYGIGWTGTVSGNKPDDIFNF
jgi:hypothetical protein